MALDISTIHAAAAHPQGESVRQNPAVPAAPRAEAPVPAPLIPSDLQATIREMEKLATAFNRRLSFSVNPKLDSIVVKVIDSETDKVVREIPPAELQHVYEAIRETIGLLFDSKA